MVAGIVLAAGSSVRMGRNKLLLTLAGETVVRRAAHRAAAVLDPVVVVLGHEAERVQQELEGLGCRSVVNAEYGRGLQSSLKAGIAALPAEAAAAVVLLADMPLVTSGMIAALVERHRASGVPLVISRYGEVVAPPHLYARSLFAELMQAQDGGKQVIGRHRDVAEVCTWPLTALADLDLPADRARVEALLARES